MIVTWNSSYQVRVYVRCQYFSIANDYIWVVAISAPGHLCPMKAVCIACESIHLILFIMYYDALQLFNWLCEDLWVIDQFLSCQVLKVECLLVPKYHALDCLNSFYGYAGITQSLDFSKDDTSVREMLNIVYLYFCLVI